MAHFKILTRLTMIKRVDKNKNSITIYLRTAYEFKNVLKRYVFRSFF